MLNLLSAGIEDLISDNQESKHVVAYENRMSLKDELVSCIEKCKSIADIETPKIVAQAMLESGFVSMTDRSFSFDQLISYLYGAKIVNSLVAFMSAFHWLESNGFTNEDNSYNSYGDNYFHVLKFDLKPSIEDQKTHEIVKNCLRLLRANHEKNSTDSVYKGFRRILSIKTQSCSYSFMVQDCIFTGSPRIVVFIKHDHDMYKQMLLSEFDFENDNGWSAYNLDIKNRIITTCEIRSCETKPVFISQEIDRVLFYLNSIMETI